MWLRRTTTGSVSLVSEVLPGADAEPPIPVRATRADALKRADEAWRLRVSGASWGEVADLVGYTDRNNALRAVRNVYGTLPQIERDELRALWRDRLEWLWRQVAHDVTEQRPGAAVAGVRVAQAATRLDGLDMPSEVVVYTPDESEIDAFVIAATSYLRPQVEEADIFEDITADET